MQRPLQTEERASSAKAGRKRVESAKDKLFEGNTEVIAKVPQSAVISANGIVMGLPNLVWA